jgi:hypothetical protein
MNPAAGALLEFPSGVSVQQPGQAVAPLSRPHGITGKPHSPLREGPKMHAIEEVVSRLIAGGTLVACAVIEGASKKRSSGADRAARYRERKAAESVTKRDAVTPSQATPERDETVTKRDNVTGTNTKKENNSSRRRTASRTSLPSNFELNDTMRAFSASKGFDPPRTTKEFEKFCNYHGSKGSLFADWNAAWRTWVSNAIDYARGTPGTEQGGFKWNGGIEGVI